MLPGQDPATGRPRKRRFGPWMPHLFRVLARLKGLRGTPFDPFGYFPERRRERRLIGEYRALLDGLLPRLDAGNITTATRIAAAASDIAGYGPVKASAIERYEQRVAELLTLW